MARPPGPIHLLRTAVRICAPLMPHAMGSPSPLQRSAMQIRRILQWRATQACVHRPGSQRIKP